MAKEKLTAILSFIRHGEKNENGDLTQEGFEQAERSGLKMKHLEGDIILFHSGVQRVKDTIKTAANYLHLKEKPIKAIKREYSLQEYTVTRLHYLNHPSKIGKYFAKWEQNEKGEYARMEEFLELDDKSPESEIFPSPMEMARRIGDIISTQIKFAAITDPSYRTNFINGTHEPNLTAFLYYFFNDYKSISPKRFLNNIGGIIDFTDGFDIKVYQKDLEISKIEFYFRTFKKEFDLNKLEEFIKREEE